jgi:uroporphyrinogen-III synthase
MMTVLSTRTILQEDISRAKSLGLDIRCTDLTEIIPVEFDLPYRPTDAIVFTSANAVRYFLAKPAADEYIKQKKIYALNGKTADELLKHRLQIIWAGENAAQLSETVIQSGAVSSVQHICGDLVLDTVSVKMKEAHIAYTPLVVYRTALQKVSLKEDFDGVMFYSPSGVESFFAANELSDKSVVCCIGDTTAEAVKRSAPNSKIIISPLASLAAMIDAIANYFQSNRAV